jgi:hypothetical protein
MPKQLKKNNTHTHTHDKDSNVIREVGRGALFTMQAVRFPHPDKAMPPLCTTLSYTSSVVTMAAIGMICTLILFKTTRGRW